MFLETGEGNEKERERNIDWLPLWTHNPGTCPDQESNWQPFPLPDNARPTEPLWSGPCYPFSLPIPPSIDIEVGSGLRLLWAMLQWMWKCRHLLEIMVSFPLDMWPEVGLLNHVENLFLISWGTSILLFLVAVPIYIPTNNAKLFPSLYILVGICYFLSFL